MNIAFLLDGFAIGGTELNATRTLEAFARRNIPVTVLHLHQGGALHARVEATGHRMVHIPIAPLWSPSNAARALAVARVLREIKATLLHSQDVYTNVVAVVAGRKMLGLPVVTSRRWKDDVPREILTPMNAWAHRNSALVLPNSGALTSTLIAEGVRPERIVVHENFVDASALNLRPAAEVQQWRRELGIPVDAIVVGCVARLGGVKRHDVLVDAFAAVQSETASAHLVLVGDGSERQALQERVRSHGIDARVTFTGTLPNSPLSQQLFDIAVLTSENEGFPNSLVEASACGIPLVATRVGGVPDVLIEGETGRGVDVGDVNGTRDAILSLVRDAGMRERMGASGRARVAERFSEAAAVERLVSIYERVSR